MVRNGDTKRPAPELLRVNVDNAESANAKMKQFGQRNRMFRTKIIFPY